MKSRQEILDAVIEHAKKGVRAMDDDGGGSCFYRMNCDANSEIRCFVGSLIRDEDYTPRMEGWGVSDLFCSFLGIMNNSGLKSNDTTFLCDLQRIHDIYEPAEWKNKLSELVQDYKLQFNW